VNNSDDLFLHEEILLLALKDEEGTLASGTLYNYAVGGAILAELLLGQRIAVDPSKKKLVSVIHPEPLHDALIDEWLVKMSNAKRPKSLQVWVSQMATTKDLKHRIALPLCQRGILRLEEKKILLLFTQRIYPEISPEPEHKIIDRLHRAIFTDTESIDARTVVLVSLAKNANLLAFLFGKKNIQQRNNRIEQIVNGEITGKATQEAIAAMQAAVMIAMIMPAMMAGVMSSTSH
jgi:Golgi phosphoprotein 3